MKIIALKKLLWLDAFHPILFALFFALAYPQAQAGQNDLPARICILLQGYNPDVHKQYADLLAPDLLFPRKEQIHIAPEGRIEAAWTVGHTRELILDYEGLQISLIVGPGDSVSLTLPIDNLLDETQPLHAVVGVDTPGATD